MFSGADADRIVKVSASAPATMYHGEGLMFPGADAGRIAKVSEPVTAFTKDECGALLTLTAVAIYKVAAIKN